METRAHYIIVGLFTVVVMACALLFSLWLNSQGGDGKFNIYNVLFTESVNGLTEGSGVQYSGIKVGEVTQLRLDQKDPDKVWARIRVNTNTPIRKNTKARLLITGITGSAIIQLSGDSTNSPLLIAEDDKIPTIVAAPSPLNKLLNNGQDLVIGINELLAHSKMMFSQENINNLSNSLRNMEQVTEVLAKERNNIGTLIEQLNKAGREMAGLSTDAHQLLNEQGKAVLDNALVAVNSVEQLTARMNALLLNNQHSLSSGMEGLAQIGPTLFEVRKTAAALRTVVDRLQDNPGGYLTGQERVKEFTP